MDSQLASRQGQSESAADQDEWGGQHRGSMHLPWVSALRSRQPVSDQSLRCKIELDLPQLGGRVHLFIYQRARRVAGWAAPISFARSNRRFMKVCSASGNIAAVRMH